MQPPPFPPQHPPFAVRDVTRIQADLFPMGSEINGRIEQGHFVADEHWEADVLEKLALLERDSSLRHQIVTDDPAGLAEALWRVGELIAADQPTLWRVEPGGASLPRFGLRLIANSAALRLEPGIDDSMATPSGRRIARWLRAQRGVDRLLDALALTVQEDIVIMRGLPDGADVCEALQVSFPSGWDPREKAGRSFASIHRPVADSDRLVSSSPNVMRAMIGKGPYLRFTFGLSFNPLLDNHPATHNNRQSFADFDDFESLLPKLHVRMERQTTCGFPDLQRALFSIRIYVNPLLERIERDPALRPRIANLVRTAIPDVRDYKGYTPYAERLIAWLESESNDDAAPSRARYRKSHADSAGGSPSRA
jgi:hypothetical protein